LNCTDQTKRCQLVNELDNEKSLIRKRSLANIRLISELYLNDRVRDETIDICITQLIQNRNENSIECLCTLLRLVGKRYEKSEFVVLNKNKFNQQMKTLFEFSIYNEKPTRTTCLIKSIIELNENGWSLN